ncbi:MAG: hypothetical protein WHT46_09290, partial [Candidatus Geothermincolales bacterium]
MGERKKRPFTARVLGMAAALSSIALLFLPSPGIHPGHTPGEDLRPGGTMEEVTSAADPGGTGEA